MTMTDTPDFSRGAAYVDGAFVPMAEARIPVTDRGFTWTGSSARWRDTG